MTTHFRPENSFGCIPGRVIADHSRFTDCAPDFIVNDGIKYRMGKDAEGGDGE